MEKVIVSGASRGIGLALVAEYLVAGYGVHAICRDPAASSGLTALKATWGDALELHPGDVSDARSGLEVRSAVGDAPVALLLNVAGVLLAEQRPEDAQLDRWAQSFDVMITGPFRMALAFLPNLVAAQGKMVSITSQLGASDWPGGGFYSYGAAKAGLNRAMKSLAVDLRERRVVVAVIHPGHVRTDMGGPDGEISPEDSARGIRKVVERLDMDRSGSFLDWDGSERAW